MNDIAALLIGKLALYFAVCMTAPKLLSVSPKERSVFALSWAALRLGIGLLATYPIILLLSLIEKAGAPFHVSYAVVLLSVRAVLWWSIAAFICERHKPHARPRIAEWTFLSVCASFAVDALAWLSGANFKFFC